jgi:hypothetical protein
VQGATKVPIGVQGQHPGAPGFLAFLSIAEGISKMSFFRKMKWKKVNFSIKIY